MPDIPSLITGLRRLFLRSGQQSTQLLISTSQSVLQMDTATGKTEEILHSEGLYYGLATAADGHYWVGARRRKVSDPLPAREERGVLIELDQRLQPCRQLEAPFPLRDLHAIAWAQGRLWVTCSHDDLVAIVDPTTGHWQQWRPLDAEAGPDQYHYNSLYFEGDYVWVLAHRRGPSWLLAFELAAALEGKTTPPLQRVVLGVEAHNIWREQDELRTCSSARGELVGERGWNVSTGGFPRGIARLDNGCWAVGVSEISERAQRDFTDGEIVLFDPQWREQRRISLPGVGLVLDLMARSPVAKRGA